MPRYTNAAAKQEQAIKSRLKKYGIERFDYVRLRNAQGNKCAICGFHAPGSYDLVVDHDHLTMAVRGLLCKHCNTALGMMRDNAAVLRAAADYLDRTESLPKSRYNGGPIPSTDVIVGKNQCDQCGSKLRPGQVRFGRCKPCTDSARLAKRATLENVSERELEREASSRRRYADPVEKWRAANKGWTRNLKEEHRREMKRLGKIEMERLRITKQERSGER